jgi:hypothetical protein
MTRTAARWIVAVSVCSVVAGVATSIVPRSRAQAQQNSQPFRSVHSLRVAEGDASTITDMGQTYHFLEARAKRVTTRYDDGSAVAERGADGSFRTSLRDAAGNDLSRLAVEHGANGALRVEITAGGERVFTQPRTEVRPTLDWANQQVYALWKDRPSSAEDIEWKGTFIRSRGAAASPLQERSAETETEFDNGLRVVSSRNTKEIQISPGVCRRPTFISHVTSNGVDVGTMRWYANEKVLAWEFPGLSKGYVDADRLKQSGGWTFTPTQAWANVQGLAFYEFHTRMKTQGSVAQAKPSLPRRLLDSFAPAVSANEPGCDILHWLDNTVFRPCCDSHDRCYERNYGCTARSWYWVNWFGNDWSCAVCNSIATVCFMTRFALIDYDDIPHW